MCDCNFRFPNTSSCLYDVVRRHIKKFEFWFYDKESNVRIFLPLYQIKEKPEGRLE